MHTHTMIIYGLILIGIQTMGILYMLAKDIKGHKGVKIDLFLTGVFLLFWLLLAIQHLAIVP